jgi:hypothetical protein
MRKQLCVVHGKAKPFICQSVEPESQHIRGGTWGNKCHNCGLCCHTSVHVSPDEVININKRIRQREKILKKVGVDSNKVVDFINNEGRVPTRSYVGAGDLQGESFLPSNACALLVPEYVLRKRVKKSD